MAAAADFRSHGARELERSGTAAAPARIDYARGIDQAVVPAVERVVRDVISPSLEAMPAALQNLGRDSL